MALLSIDRTSLVATVGVMQRRAFIPFASTGERDAQLPAPTVGTVSVIGTTFEYWDGAVWQPFGGGGGGTVGPEGPAGPAGPEGPQGDPGPAGAAGTPGAQGPKGDTGAQGIQGIQGTAGTAGTAGTPGEKWFTAAGAPAGATGIVGDWYLNSTNGDYHEKTGASTWTLRGNLKGAGVPVGGATGTVLAKSSATDYATTWVANRPAITRGRVLNVAPNASGLVTTAHGLGVAPASVIATPFNGLLWTAVITNESVDATNFVSAFWKADGSNVVGPDVVSFNWLAVA